MICSANEVKSEATVFFGARDDERYAVAAEGMAMAANELLDPEAVCGGKWKRHRKTVEKQLKRAARQELKMQLGISTVALWFLGWLIQRVFEWFTAKYLGNEQ